MGLGRKLWGLMVFLILLPLVFYLFLLAANCYYAKRAAYLLKQIRSIKIDNSSVGELKRLGSEHGFRYEETPAGKCRDIACLNYVITNNTWIYSILSTPVLAKFGQRTGLRPWFAVGDIEIRNGQVVGKVYGVQFHAGRVPREIEAAAWDEKDPQISVCSYFPFKRHPGYGFRNATNVRSFAALISDGASPENRDHAFQFNLKCLTSRLPCDSFSEIMPAAWSDYEADAKWSETHENNLVWQVGKQCPY